MHFHFSSSLRSCVMLSYCCSPNHHNLYLSPVLALSLNEPCHRFPTFLPWLFFKPSTYRRMLWLASALFVGMSSLCGFCGHEYRRVVDDGMVVYVAVTGTGDAGLRRLY
jgi:hypothetical protein